MYICEFELSHFLHIIVLVEIILLFLCGYYPYRKFHPQTSCCFFFFVPGAISADVLTTTSTVFSVPGGPSRLPWPRRNVVGGEWLAGNWYVDYTGRDTTGDGIGDTELPYTSGGAIKGGGGDRFPYKIPNSP